jgi:hypothetical protein
MIKAFNLTTLIGKIDVRMLFKAISSKGENIGYCKIVIQNIGWGPENHNRAIIWGVFGFVSDLLSDSKLSC